MIVEAADWPKGKLDGVRGYVNDGINGRNGTLYLIDLIDCVIQTQYTFKVPISQN